jgi:ADP-ribose pyrophosphatase YjhB (NUDIX family)
MSPAQQIALWADKLRDISAMGGHFARNPYDAAHYRAVQDIAIAMLALATETPLEEMEPLRATVFARPTPLVAGEAAVIDPADGRILLIRRADNGLWAMPGGAFEVGETPAEGAVREALEETGIQCEPVALAGVFDSRLCGASSRHHVYCFLLLCRPLNRNAPQAPLTPDEIGGIGWFAEDEMPEDLDPGHVSRIPEAFRLYRDKGSAYFDR